MYVLHTVRICRCVSHIVYNYFNMYLQNTKQSWDFHTFAVVSRYRDPQLKTCENH